jgi:hypothetical protein
VGIIPFLLFTGKHGLPERLKAIYTNCKNYQVNAAKLLAIMSIYKKSIIFLCFRNRA